MCGYFSCIALPNGQIRWTEEDSHETIIDRLHLVDDEEGDRRKFVRIEVEEGDMDNYDIDEDADNMPSWYLDHENEYYNKVASIIKRLTPVTKQVEKVRERYNAAVEKIENARERDYYRINKKADAMVKAGEDSELVRRWQDVERGKSYLASCQKLYDLCQQVVKREQAIQSKIAKIPGYVARKQTSKGE